jgi:alpha-1,2-mannosyltransferase
VLLRLVRRADRLLTWKRACVYSVPVIAMFVAAWVYTLIGAQPPLNAQRIPIGGDYIAFHTAGLLLMQGHGEQLYERALVVATQDDVLHGAAPGFYDAFRNPPFFALPFAPLSSFDLIPGYAVWSVLSLAFLALALWLLLQDAPELQARWRGLWILVFAFPPVIIGFLDGQNATLSLLLYVLIYRSLIRGQDRAAGVWAALGLFKPQLFIVFPIIYLASRRWPSLAAYAATALTLGLVSFAFVGLEGTLGWLRILLDMETANSAANAWRMHSLKAFFDLLLPGQPSLSLALYAVASATLLGVLAWFWSRRSFADDPRRVWALTSIVAVLVDPHIVDYDLAVLIPAAIFLAMLVPALRWTIVAMYPLSLIRVPALVGDMVVQPTVIVLLSWAAALAHDCWRTLPTRTHPANRLDAGASLATAPASSQPG